MFYREMTKNLHPAYTKKSLRPFGKVETWHKRHKWHFIEEKR